MWFVTVMKLFETVNRNVLYLLLKATAQIQQQSTKSSSIILALTDGKLEVYIHELTKQQVSFASLTHQTHTLNLFVFILFRHISYPEAIFSSSFLNILISLMHCSFYSWSFPFCLFLSASDLLHIVCLSCRLMKPGNMALVFTALVSWTLMSSR